MIKAYVINLDRDHQRLAHMERQGDAYGIDWIRVAATDKFEESIVRRAAAAKPGRLGFTMSAGAIACFESHRKAWKLIVDSGDEYGAVFEDDMVCGAALAQILSSTEWIPADCDIAKLETFFERATVNTSDARSYQGRKLLRLYGRHLGSCAYVVSRQTAGHLLSFSQKITDPVDEVLFNEQSLHFPRLKLYQMDPAPCIQAMLLEKDKEQGYLASGNDENLKLKKKPYRNLGHYLTRKVVRIWGKLLGLLGYRERRRIEFKPD